MSERKLSSGCNGATSLGVELMVIEKFGVKNGQDRFFEIRAVKRLILPISGHVCGVTRRHRQEFLGSSDREFSSRLNGEGISDL